MELTRKEDDGLESGESDVDEYVDVVQVPVDLRKEAMSLRSSAFEHLRARHWILFWLKFFRLTQRAHVHLAVAVLG